VSNDCLTIHPHGAACLECHIGGRAAGLKRPAGCSGLELPERYPRTALRWHGRLCREVNVSLEEAQAILSALVLIASERKGNAAFALADLLSRRGLEHPCKPLVAWAQEA
jgi:hypothetical protein